MNHDKDAHPGDDPEELPDDEQHEEPEADEDATSDDAAGVEGSEDDPEQSGVVRMSLDEIKQRAEERYGDLSPEEAEAQSLADLQNTWSQINAKLGPDLSGLSTIADRITRDVGRSITRSMMPQMRLTSALDLSLRNPLMDAFKDVMPSGSLAGIDMSRVKTFRDISSMMPSGLPLPDVDADTSADEEPRGTAEDSLVIPDSPDEVEGEARRIVREDPELIAEVEVALYARFLSNQARMQKSIEQQSEDLRTILETMREQTASVHKTARAMQRQLKQAKKDSARQHTQHQQAMKWNRWSLGVSAVSVLVAMATLIFSLAGGCSPQNEPVEVEQQAPPASGTPAPSPAGATSPPQ